MKALHNLPRLLKLLKGPNYPEIRAGRRAVSRELEIRGRHFIPADVSGIQAEVSVYPFVRPPSLLGLRSCPLSWEWVTATMVTRHPLSSFL